MYHSLVFLCRMILSNNSKASKSDGCSHDWKNLYQMFNLYAYGECHLCECRLIEVVLAIAKNPVHLVVKFMFLICFLRNITLVLIEFQFGVCTIIHKIKFFEFELIFILSLI